ncbi:5626_t:CDS:1, partial [Gigaspora margarita]
MQPYKIFIVFLLVLLIAYSTIVLSNYGFNGSELKGNKPEEYKLEERYSNVALNLFALF